MYIKQDRLLEWGLYSIVIYITLHFIFIPDGFTLKNILITSFLPFSVLTICSICIIKSKSLKEVSLTSRILFYGVVFWGLVTTVRGFSLVIQDWITNFGNVFTGFAWLVPVTLILGLKIENWSIVFKVLSVAFIIMIAMTLLLPFLDLNEEWIWLLRPVNFIMLTAFYHYKFKNRLKTYIAVICYIIISYLGSRRLEFLYLGITLCFLLMDKLISLNLKKKLLKYILIFFVLIFIIIFTVGYEFISSLVSSVIDFQETRVFLFTELFEELSKTNDKLIGRGSMGTYYSDFFERTRRYYKAMGNRGWRGDDPTRITIEVGYLQMILKGGFIMLFLHITTYVYAAYVAIFKSNNKFVKRLGYYILIISMVVLIEFRPAFTPTFIILWMAIGTVLNKKYREMDDVEIEKLIKFK